MLKSTRVNDFSWLCITVVSLLFCLFFPLSTLKYPTKYLNESKNLPFFIINLKLKTLLIHQKVTQNAARTVC